MKLLKIYAFSFILFFLSSTTAHAGGGRIEFKKSFDGYVGDKANIYGFVHKAAGNYDFSVGEEFEVIMENPRPGDVCVLTQPVVDKFGMITGYCTATTPGEVSPNLRSKANGDMSGPMLLTFTKRAVPVYTAPVVSQTIPTVTKAIFPTNIPTSTPVALSPKAKTILISSAKKNNTGTYILLALASISFLTAVYLFIRALRQNKNKIVNSSNSSTRRDAVAIKSRK